VWSCDQPVESIQPSQPSPFPSILLTPLVLTNNLPASDDNMDTSPIEASSPLPHSEGVMSPGAVSDDFSWTCGDDPRISHIAMIGIGAYGEVHRVTSIEDVSESIDGKHGISLSRP